MNGISPTEAHQTPAVNVYISYVEKDLTSVDRLKIHLNPLESKGIISLWDISKIVLGSKQLEEIIAKEANSAKIAILLVSADYLASLFVRDKEIPNLLNAHRENQCELIPVLISACAYINSPIANFANLNQMLWDARYLKEMDYETREKAYNDIRMVVTYRANEIRQAYKEEQLRERERIARENAVREIPALPQPSTKGILSDWFRRYKFYMSTFFTALLIVFGIIWFLNKLLSDASSPNKNNAISSATATVLPDGNAQNPTPTINTSLKKSEDPNGVVAIAWSPDGKAVVYGSGDKTAGLVTPNGIRRKIADFKDRVSAVVWSNDGKFIAAGSRDFSVKIFKADGTFASEFKGSNSILTLAWSPDSTLLAIGSLDKTINLIKPDGTLYKNLEGHTGGVVVLDWQKKKDAPLLASGSLDGTARIWNTNSSEMIDKIPFEQRVSDVKWSATEMLAVSSWDSRIALWKNKGIWISNKTTYGFAHKVAWSPDKTTLAVTYENSSISLWALDISNLPSLKEVKNLKAHSSVVLALAWSPDGKILASGSWDKTVRYWDKNGNPIGEPKTHSDRIHALAWSPDSTILVACDESNTIKFWDRNSKVIS